MREFDKPSVIVSKCLGFAECRYDGKVINDEFVDRLRPYVTFHPVCPEVEIGLGVPRSPIRLVLAGNELRLVQPATGNDVTEKMKGFTRSFLQDILDVDGFILKNRSPSCGIKDVRIYPGPAKVASIGRGAGFFGGAVIKGLPHLAIEDEGRLQNLRIREHFLTKLFTLSAFRTVKRSNSFKYLVDFHTRNKFLLMAYNQRELRELGRVTANREREAPEYLIERYQVHLFRALSRAPSYTSIINVLMHSLGYFSKGLSSREKSFFLESLQRYRSGRIPLRTVTSLLESWIIRFDEEYLAQQTFFEPYPEDLMLVPHYVRLEG
ncbi:MAG: DUF523 and DUF1722 domain-containing protein [candidate division WOR-3 bacterium]